MSPVASWLKGQAKGRTGVGREFQPNIEGGEAGRNSHLQGLFREEVIDKVKGEVNGKTSFLFSSLPNANAAGVLRRPRD